MQNMINSQLNNLNNFIKTKNNLLKKNKGQKHFPAAINEWKISSYNFNKSYQRNIASRNDMTDKLIKSYFYFSKLKSRPRSKRMRSLRKKFTTTKIFVSRSEIKQTNDKVIVTLFTYNREKQFLLKKLFHYNRRLRYLDTWRMSKTINKELNFNNIYKNKPVNMITARIIKQNKTLYAQFISELIDGKDKVNLYNKIAAKVETKSNVDHNIIANKYKKIIYNETRKLRFKKKKKTIRIIKYIRKKMKRFKVKPRIRKNRFDTAKPRKTPNWGIKLKNEMNFLSFKILLGNKRLAYIRKLFYFYFLKYILSMFNLKVTVNKTSNVPTNSLVKEVMYADEMLNIEKEAKKKKKGKRNKKTRFVFDTNKNIVSIYNSPRAVGSKGNTVQLCIYKIKKDTKKIKTMLDTRTNTLTNNVFNFSKSMVINLNVESENKIDNLDNTLSNINFIISQFLDKILTNSKVGDKERKLYILYKTYYKNYYKNYIRRLAKKQKLLSVYYTRFMVNKFKFSNWLPNLKLGLGKIYNKKIELNIINLKYPHLNTDIYSKLISLKLKNKLNALAVIKKGLKFAKRPGDYLDKSEIEVDYDLNKSSSLNRYKSLKIRNTNLTELLNKIYPRSMVNNTNSINKTINRLESKVIKSKIKNVLMLIKYKALSGVRLEAAGRLTRRYTASRSVYKFKYKGNLKNIDHSRRLELEDRSQSAVMLRNQVRANSQYSVTHSKRRVGSFGIKGWVSAY